MSRKRNWSQYNKDLVKRGSFTFFIDVKSINSRPKKCVRGRPRIYANPLIQTLLILKIQYRMPYRMLEGFAKNLLPKFHRNILLPSYSVVCRRAQELSETLPKLSSRRPHTILLDASGIKIYGEGEWKVKIHGQSKRRKWIKIHIAIDENSQEILALQVTDGHAADCAVGPSLIERCPRSTKIYKADGAYDTKKVRNRIRENGARALIPPRRNAKQSKNHTERDTAIAELRGLGLDKIGRSLWGKLTGYSRRALVETAFFRLKGMYGGSFFSRTSNRQSIEAHLKCYMLNKMREQMT